jgi:hypothetical protein
VATTIPTRIAKHESHELSMVDGFVIGYLLRLHRIAVKFLRQRPLLDKVLVP